MSSNQQPTLVDLLAGTQADLIAYQRKHINELNQVINQVTAERNALREQLATQTVDKKDNM